MWIYLIKAIVQQGWTISAIFYCNTILYGWYCIGIATSNSEYWAILENTNKLDLENYELRPYNGKSTTKITIISKY
jgi:hypothetical protein